MTAPLNSKYANGKFGKVTTQTPGNRFDIPFPTVKGMVIKNAYPLPCGCSWVYAPDITRRYDRPFAVKFPYRFCKHWRQVNR